MPHDEYWQGESEPDVPDRYEGETRGNAKQSNDESMPSEQFEPLTLAFREQLIACLEECARGRRGLFTDLESAEHANLAWPEAARLRELAFALQAILAQAGETDALCDQFLDLCSIHGEADPGEPRLARAFLAEIHKEA